MVCRKKDATKGNRFGEAFLVQRFCVNENLFSDKTFVCAFGTRYLINAIALQV